MVVRRSDTKALSKPPSRISIFQQSRGNKLHRTEQSGEASSKEVLVNMRQKESAKPSRNVHSEKPELKHHQQISLALTSVVVPSAKDSLELKSVLSAILEHSNSSISRMWLRLVIVSNNRRTIMYLSYEHFRSMRMSCGTIAHYMKLIHLRIYNSKQLVQ